MVLKLLTWGYCYVVIGVMAVIRAILWVLSVAVLLLGFGLATISAVQQSAQAPAKELVQFINDAKRRGVKEDKIKQQAVAVGWPAAAVDEAIANQKDQKASPPAASSPVVNALPNATPASSMELQPTAPGMATAEAPDAPGAPAGTPRSVPATNQAYEYQIGSGDTLQISVWKEPEASVPSVVVRPDGKITVPLIKEVEVAGLTPREVEKAITNGLSKYITDANVTVVVTAMTSKKVYVTGGVKKEGPVPYTYGMTVLQALSEAGGLTDYAKRKKIYILRTESGREYRLDFNYDEVVKGERIEQNILLLPNDTLVIPHY